MKSIAAINLLLHLLLIEQKQFCAGFVFTADVNIEPVAEKSAYAIMLNHIVQEIIYSPINFTLLLIISFLIYKIIRDRFGVWSSQRVQKPPEPQLPRIRRDFTVAELKQYDGTQPDGRILVAVNGFVFDVTSAKRNYGPGEFLISILFSEPGICRSKFKRDFILVILPISLGEGKGKFSNLIT